MQATGLVRGVASPCLPAAKAGRGVRSLALPRSARGAPCRPARQVVAVRASENDGPSTSSRPEEPQLLGGFGYTRADVLVLGAGLVVLGYAMYYGLQATGMDAGLAGNWVQLIIFLGICIGWISTYLWRVATKNMTYVRQLEAYEEAVMRKRLEEMPESELEQMMADVEREKQELKIMREQKIKDKEAGKL